MAQTKMSLSELQTRASAYVTAMQQGGAWQATTNNVAHLLDKIGSIITIDGDFNDKLPMLDGEDLPLGKTVEEYFCDLYLPVVKATAEDFTLDAAPSFEFVAYHYDLGERTIYTERKYNDVERACNNPSDVGSIVAKIMERLTDSFSMWKYAQKKQLLGNAIAKAQKAGLVTTIAKPISDVTGEAFIKEVKTRVENASFANEGNNLGNYLIGAAPSLTLFIKKGVMPSIEVDTLAGAFNEGKLAIPAKIVIVDDFGSDTVDVKAGDGVSPHVADNVDNSKVYAFLVDERGIKMCNSYQAVRTRELAQCDKIQYFLHSDFTGVISKSVFMRVYKEA